MRFEVALARDVDSPAEARRLEVCDLAAGFEPAESDPRPARPAGWGLYLVRELSDRWGVERSAETRVWFELDREAA